MLQARLLAYQDAQRYRVGVNHNQLPVNAPRCPVHHYQRDGAMAGMASPANGNQGGGINFYPNDRLAEASPRPDLGVPPLPLLEEAWVQPFSQDDEDYFRQAGDLFRIMSDDQKAQLAATIAGGLSQAEVSVQQRMLVYLDRADSEYASRVRDTMV